jgi:hypothetical protein
MSGLVLGERDRAEGGLGFGKKERGEVLKTRGESEDGCPTPASSAGISSTSAAR